MDMSWLQNITSNENEKSNYTQKTNRNSSIIHRGQRYAVTPYRIVIGEQ